MAQKGSFLPMTTSHQQQYPKLEESQQEIRIFRLFAGSGDEEVAGELLPVPLSRILNDPSAVYEALSYAWGNVNDKVPISCRFHQINSTDTASQVLITRNLYGALKRLRLANSARLLWIDAICINQSDISERNSQVRHMAEIYSSAQRVLVWLGEDTGFDPFEGMVLGLKRITDRFQSNVGYIFSAPSESLPQTLPIFARSWFRRKWIIQEVLLAKEVIMHCGPYQASFDDIQRLVSLELQFSVFKVTRTVFDKTADLEEVFNAFIGVSNVLFIGRCRAGAVYMNLANLLLETRTFECGDPRDFLFSILSIAIDLKDDTHGSLRADYNLSLEDVVLRATKWILEHEGPDVLCQVSGSDWKLSLGEGPLTSTWAAAGFLQIINKDREDLITPLTKPGIQPKWRTWGKTTNPTQFPTSISSDGKLHISGAIVDQIGTIASDIRQTGHFQTRPFSMDTYRMTESTFICAQLQNWWAVAQQSRSQQVEQRKGVHASESIDLSFAKLVLCAEITDHEKLVQKVGNDWVELLKRYEKYLISWAMVMPETGRLTDSLAALDRTVRTLTMRRNFAITREDRLALLPPSASVGDFVCAFPDTQCPYLLRPLPNGEWAVIGEVYVGGLMLKSGFDVNSISLQKIIIR